MRRALGTAAGGGGLISMLMTSGWAGAALIALVAAISLGALCWIIADPERPGRLALIIGSCRKGTAAKERGPAPAKLPGRKNAVDDENRPSIVDS